MINIKSFAKRRNSSTATVITNSTSGSSSSSGTTTPTNDWFFYNDDNGFVTCKYPFASVDNIVAFADGTEASGGGSGSGSGSTVVVDNLTSYSTSYSLSANQGRILKSLIDNIQTQSGGQQFTGTIDWSNVQNVPTSFNPSPHVHTISEVTDLQTQLTNLGNNTSTLSSNIAAHANDSNIHLTATEKNVIDNLTLEQIQFIVKLMNTLTIDNAGNCTFNGNVNSKMNVTAMVSSN